jgi:uncharacterized protein YjaZ
MNSKTEKYEIINLGPSFELFWSMAKDKNFDEQLKIWDEIVEIPNQDFFEGLVNSPEFNKDWNDRKKKRLSEAFKNYQSDFESIDKLFKAFNFTLVQQIEHFKKFFPDANFDIPIIAMPGATFNGKGGLTKKHELILAFGMDMIHFLNGNPDVLYSHELFHIYHLKKADVTVEYFMKSGKMTLPLFLEGLATHVSYKMNPTASLDDILMDKDLSKLSLEDEKYLAKIFLTIANDRAYNEEHPENHRKWFGSKTEKLRADLPNRVGYYLGLKVVDKLEKRYPLLEICSWHPSVAHEHILEELKNYN